MRSRVGAIGLAGTVVLLVLLVLSVGSAAAQDTGAEERSGSPRVVINGSVNVVAGETVDAVFVINGNVTVREGARVDGPVVAIRGNVRVAGDVDDDVFALSGRVVVAPTGRVDGDVTSSKEPRVEDEATVTGDVERFNPAGYATALGWFLLGAWWVAVSVSTLVLGLVVIGLFPRAVDAAIGNARARPGRTIVAGLIVGVGGVVFAGIALVTLVGIPLGFAVLGALTFLMLLGYVVTAMVLGRLLVKAPRTLPLAFLAGWAILRVVALAPVLGLFAWHAAALFGLGAVALAAWNAARRPADVAPAVASA